MPDIPEEEEEQTEPYIKSPDESKSQASTIPAEIKAIPKSSLRKQKQVVEEDVLSDEKFGEITPIQPSETEEAKALKKIGGVNPISFSELSSTRKKTMFMRLISQCLILLLK